MSMRSAYTIIAGASLSLLRGFLLVGSYHVIFPLTIEHVIQTWPIIGPGLLTRARHVI